MENTPRLYCELVALLGQPGKWRDGRQLYPLRWMVVGLSQSGGVSLTAWVPLVSSRARSAQSTQRRLASWLQHARMEVHCLSAPLLHQAVAAWGNPTRYLALETTRLGNRYCVIRISLRYRGRAVPVVGEVLEQGSSSGASAT
jgi:hypothetical protein